MIETAPDSPYIISAQWVLPIARPPIENGYIRIQGDRICEVGRMADLPEYSRPEPPKAGTLLTPGLVNCHLHLEQSFPAVIAKAPGQPFTDWLLNVVRLLREQSSTKEKIQRCKSGAEELLRTGTTCVNDIASGPESLQVFDQMGLRGIVSLEVFHPDASTVNISGWIAAYQAFCQGYEDHSRLKPGLSPHSPYNVSPAAWIALLDACQPSAVHTHLAEFEDEALYLKRQPSCIQHLHQTILGRSFMPHSPATSPVEALGRHNLLNNRLIAAHAIHTSADDRECLRQHGVTIAHCPRSNLALHGKTLTAPNYQASGLTLGLGTDGRLSTPDLDLRAEARCAMQQHHWSAAQAVEAMTLAGAKTLGMDSQIGSLEPGKQADLVLWQAEAIGISPEAQLLHETTQAVQVMIAGQTRWKGGV